MTNFLHLFDNSNKPKIIWLHGRKYYSKNGFSIKADKSSNNLKEIKESFSLKKLNSKFIKFQ